MFREQGLKTQGHERAGQERPGSPQLKRDLIGCIHGYPTAEEPKSRLLIALFPGLQAASLHQESLCGFINSTDIHAQTASDGK